MKWKHVIGDVEVNRDLILLLVMGDYTRSRYLYPTRLLTFIYGSRHKTM